MIIGILDVQGDVSEHVDSVERALGKAGRIGNVLRVRTSAQINGTDALVIPGGESTTLGKLVRTYELDRAIVKFANKGRPIMGTCAGMILMARKTNAKSGEAGQPLLGIMDIAVNRNAFGRQRESFEADLNIDGIGEYRAIFIRAPVIDGVGDGVDVLSRYEGSVVMARQKNLLAVAFHPELAGDTRVQEYFLGMVK